ncbi:macrophomate synthase [Fusarium mexicanum]|uniref:Macrophomate synthase n=1 Tax=Fusarium mexicanum TaxID=751941 RepID=A0A8H5MNT0_9HYPO|nr:macrophomate synthase [Fusarium mexicanum]
MDDYRAHSLFQPSNLNAAISAEGYEGSSKWPPHLFGAMLGIPHTQMARTVAVLGFDFIFVDTLHVATNPENLVSIIQTINFASEGKTCALVRIPSPESDLLAYALDAGAAGIVFPQIDTPDQAALAVNKVRHAYSGGSRSVSPIALLDGITNIAPHGWTSETIADRNIAVICQIESTVAVDNLDVIARVPGVNALMLGVSDLKVTLGLPVRNPGGRVDESKFYEAVSKLIATSKETGIQLMIPAFRMRLEDVDWLKHFKLVMTSLDVLSVLKSHQKDLTEVKEALGVKKGASNGKSNGLNNGTTNGKTNGMTNGITKQALNGH